MLGMVFTELLEMVEAVWSFEVADAVLARAGSSGVYTSVGEYADADMNALVEALAVETGVAVPDLLRAYGQHLFGRFVHLHPEFFADQRDVTSFLAGLETRVHTEVRKLYPNAHTPYFTLVDGPNGHHVLEYQSPRALAPFAEGLLSACLQHFGHRGSFTTDDLSGGAGTHVRFTFVVDRA